MIVIGDSIGLNFYFTAITNLVFFLVYFNSASAQSKNRDCNREVNYARYAKLLPVQFCMPEGYWVVDVFEADVNKDDRTDRLIKYYKKDWKCADTIFLAVFSGADDLIFNHMKTFSNLYTPIVRESMDIPWILENCEAPDSVARYAWQNSMWLRFEKGLIIVPFAVDLWNGLDFYFQYDSNRHDWFLRKQQRWYIPDGGYERTYSPDEKIEEVKDWISISKFRIRDYLQPW